MSAPAPSRCGCGSASAPLDFSRYAERTGDRFVERAVTDGIMYELMELSGREYVDVYAQKAKSRPPAETSPPETSPPETSPPEAVAA